MQRHALADSVTSERMRTTRDEHKEIAMSSLTRPVALGHVGGNVDHAVNDNGTTYCGAERSSDRTGVRYTSVTETGTTTELHHVTCKRCQRALTSRGLVA